MSEAFETKIARLRAEIGIVSKRIERLEADLKAERKLRCRLRQRHRMLHKHHTNKAFIERIREGTAKFQADSQRAEVRNRKISELMIARTADFSPEQRTIYYRMIQRGMQVHIARARALEVTK